MHNQPTAVRRLSADEKSAATRALGEAIRCTRREQGFSQEAFAAHAGLDRSYYGAIERGEFNVTFTTILKIADALTIPASALLERVRL